MSHVSKPPSTTPSAPLRAAGSPREPAVNVFPAAASDMPAIVALLRTVNLPTDDIASRPLLHCVVARSNERIVGCAAVEPLGATGLLRSVAVVPELRRHGVGAQLVAGILALARTGKLRSLFLLTTTAPAFFESLGFVRIDRDRAPREIRETSEFASLCPASAVLMHRAIANRRNAIERE